MKKRSVIPLILCLALIVGLLAGCGGQETSESPGAEEPVQSEAAAAELDEVTLLEYGRAIGYGFMPEGLENEAPDSYIVSWSEFCDMLGRMISRVDEGALPAWEEMTSGAPDTPMTRDGAMISLLFAAQTLGVDDANCDYWFLKDNYDWGAEATWDYPIFPWEEGYSSENDMMNDPDNALGPAYFFCTARVSYETRRPLLDVDWDTYDIDFAGDFTLRAAMLSAVRLYESMPNEPASYIHISEVGAYDESIITTELLSAETDLPEPSQSELPDWKGAGLAARKDSEHRYMKISEADIALLADNGFNFTRFYLCFSTLRYPDYPEDPYLVSEQELKELDQLVAWCIEYGVHLQIAMKWFLDESGSRTNVMPTTDEGWELTYAYWEAIARRYAGIPSRYLSFDLLNEIEPEGNNIAYGARKLGALADSLRAIDPERLLLISFSNNPDMQWVEEMAKLGLALGYHPYSPNYLCDGADGFTAPQASWPYPYFPVRLYEGEPMTISGDIGGNTLRIDFWYYRPFRVTFDNGETVTVNVQGDYFDEAADGWRFNEPYPIEIPEGVSSLTLETLDAGSMIYELIMEDDGVVTGLVPVDRHNGIVTGAADLVWDGESWSSDVNFTPEEIYEQIIRPVQEIAENYGVGFMLNEFGIFACNVGWDVSIPVSYTDDMIAMLEEQGIPWSLCEAEGDPYRFLAVPEGRDYEWANATIETVTYTFDDGTGMNIGVCRELMDVFRKYTLG